MNIEEARKLLNDYLDGELPPGQRFELERCLATSPLLRRELAALRGVLDAARDLPGSVAPDRDLWPDIAAALAEEPSAAPGAEPAAPRGGALAGWRRRLGEMLGGPAAGRRPAFAAAAVAAIVLLAVLAVWRVDGPGPLEPVPGGGVAVEQADPTVVAVLNDLEAECAPAPREAASFVPESQDDDRPPILDLIAHNLRIVDLAIQDARAAWEADPESPQLLRILTSAYRAKAALTRQETRLAARL